MLFLCCSGRGHSNYDVALHCGNVGIQPPTRCQHCIGNQVQRNQCLLGDASFLHCIKPLSHLFKIDNWERGKIKIILETAAHHNPMHPKVVLAPHFSPRILQWQCSIYAVNHFSAYGCQGATSPHLCSKRNCGQI